MLLELLIFIVANSPRGNCLTFGMGCSCAYLGSEIWDAPNYLESEDSRGLKCACFGPEI